MISQFVLTWVPKSNTQSKRPFTPDLEKISGALQESWKTVSEGAGHLSGDWNGGGVVRTLPFRSSGVSPGGQWQRMEWTLGSVFTLQWRDFTFLASPCTLFRPRCVVFWRNCSPVCFHWSWLSRLYEVPRRRVQRLLPSMPTVWVSSLAFLSSDVFRLLHRTCMWSCLGFGICLLNFQRRFYPSVRRNRWSTSSQGYCRQQKFITSSVSQEWAAVAAIRWSW